MIPLRIYKKFLCCRCVLIPALLFMMMQVLYAQSSQIKLIDSKSSLPVSYATVLFVDLGTKTEYFKVSDEKGIVLNPSKNKSVVKISCIGYTALVDTLTAGKSYDLFMTPTIFSLDEVVVTGNLRPQHADKSIYNIKVVGQKKIEEQGANNLKDLLTNQVNLSISQDPALGSSLKIKGLTFKWQLYGWAK